MHDEYAYLTVEHVDDAKSTFHFLRARFLMGRGWKSTGYPQRPGTVYWQKEIRGELVAMEADVAFEIEKSAT